MSNNRHFLIQSLRSCKPIDGRYTDFNCINFDESTDKKIHGFFSLVFKSIDQIGKKDVVFKFFDPIPEKLTDLYRQASFQREPILLRNLIAKKRCLQLIGNLNKYILEIPIGKPGEYLSFPCQYFITEWLPHDTDEYFQNHKCIAAINKLKIFNQLILAVEALHRNGIHHRDIKSDNFRGEEAKNGELIFKCIDLGTAARFDSSNLQKDYQNPVGCFPYASPEAFCGLAGHRVVSIASDFYAMGCLLFELFNDSIFYCEIVNDGTYKAICAALLHSMNSATDLETKVLIWQKEVNRFKHLIKKPKVNGIGSFIPPSIRDNIQTIINMLTVFDYNERPKDFNYIKRLLWSSIRMIEHECRQKRTLELKRELRKKIDAKC